MKCRFVLIRKICELQTLRFVHITHVITEFLNRNSWTFSLLEGTRPSENNGNGNDDAAIKTFELEEQWISNSTKLFRLEILGIPCDRWYFSAGKKWSADQNRRNLSSCFSREQKPKAKTADR